jgi:hypothetical protein
MVLELTHVYWMYKETVNKLDSLSRSVREGKNVHEAANFARWLEFSGYIKIFDLFPSDQKYLPVCSKTIRKKISDLIYDCGDWFKSNNISPKYHASDISEINSKLDQILKQQAGSSSVGIEPVSPLLSAHSARRNRAKGPRAGRTPAARVITV